MSEDDTPFFLKQNQGFLEADASAELLHPTENKLVKADSLTETQYFGFSVPESEIHGYAYLWHHPNLHVLTGGLWAWSGIKQYMVQSELCDFRTYMSDSALKNDLHDYRLENGFGVKILEPLKRFHMTYVDAARDNSVDLVYEAVGPAVMFGDGKHMEQPMRAVGELVLRGHRYRVDCFNVRDRSWGKARPEDNLSMPPASWMTGVFSEDFAFNCNIFDQASGNPELTGRLALPDERTLAGGWLYRDGKLSRFVRARKRVVRRPVSLLPDEIEFEATDDLARRIAVRGTLIASCPWQAWGNFNANINLMRWECEGLVAHGDCQEPLWNDYCNHVAINVKGSDGRQ
jgi:hypothetical protein